jgi:hypothetical protein
MNVQPAQATKYIVNPLTGRRVRFAKLFLTHPPTGRPGVAPARPLTSPVLDAGRLGRPEGVP